MSAFDRPLAWLLDFLKVPRQPRPPASDQHVLRVFRAAPNYWRYKLVVWSLKQTGALVGLIYGFATATFFADRVPSQDITTLIYAIEYIGWLTFVLQLPLSFAVLKLDFDMRWYILTDRSMHLREGILRLKEMTITYANVQNISIRQNPLQRLLNIADVSVRTAGGGESASDQESAGGGGMHEAKFHGVEDAEEVRNAIRERVRLYRDAGLGDHDDVVQLPVHTTSPDAVLAARNVLVEVQALRASFSPD